MPEFLQALTYLHSSAMPSMKLLPKVKKLVLEESGKDPHPSRLLYATIPVAGAWTLM